MDNNTLAQMLGDIHQTLGAVSAQVGDVKEDTTYLRDTIDAIKGQQANHETRLTVLEKERKDARYRFRSVAAWFGALAGGSGVAWEIWTALAGGHH